MYNNINLIGRLGADAELRSTPDGKTVCVFRLAVSEPRSGQGERPPTWFRIIAWDKKAELLGQLHKGDAVHVVGPHVQRPWTDREGVKRDGWEVHVRDFTFLNRRRTESQADTHSQDPYEPQRGVNDDDIPF